MAWRRFATLLRQRTDDINDGARKIVSLGVGGCIGCLFCDWFYEIHGMQPSKERRELIDAARELIKKESVEEEGLANPTVQWDCQSSWTNNPVTNSSTKHALRGPTSLSLQSHHSCGITNVAKLFCWRQLLWQNLLQEKAIYRSWRSNQRVVILEGFSACAVSERILILAGLPRSVAKPRNPLGVGHGVRTHGLR
ncbi:unnamed protein product [Camellia sinensis]